MSELQRSLNGRHHTLSRSDLPGAYEPGSICWLKPKYDAEDNDDGISDLPGGCYNHPAILLWTEDFGTKASIFIVRAARCPLDRVVG